MNSAKVSLKLLGLMLVFVLASTAFAQKPTPTPPPKVLENKDTLIINEDLITLNVTVTDNYGRYVSGLKKNAFTILDDDEKQEIEFFSDDDAPVSVGIVFDVSGSMKGDKLNRAREALGKFIQTSHPRDEYFLIAFNKRAQLLLDRTRDGEAVLNKLQLVQAKDNTALYDAVYLGTERVTRGAHQKRAIILISDGQDNNSRYTFNDVKKQIKESDVTLYSIGILGGGDNNGLGMMGQAYLDELSSVTGGSSFYPKTNAEMDEIFERIALELRHQYSIGFRPQNFANDGKWHKLKVKVKPPRGLPKLFVRTREGYFATVAPRD
jgi:Ca-activated chloride channel family protein